MSLETKISESICSEPKFSYTKEDLLLDTSYALTVLSYISPLTLGAYCGITDATNLPHSSQLPSAISINALGTTTLVALNTNGNNIRKGQTTASLGARSAAITAPL